MASAMATAHQASEPTEVIDNVVEAAP